jgi:hypothetical protein
MPLSRFTLAHQSRVHRTCWQSRGRTCASARLSVFGLSFSEPQTKTVNRQGLRLRESYHKVPPPATLCCFHWSLRLNDPLSTGLRTGMRACFYPIPPDPASFTHFHTNPRSPVVPLSYLCRQTTPNIRQTASHWHVPQSWRLQNRREPRNAAICGPLCTASIIFAVNSTLLTVLGAARAAFGYTSI